MSKTLTTLRLSVKETLLLSADVVGNGGFQSFARRVQKGLDGTVLTLTDADLGRALRHIGYGSGGYENRLRNALRRPIGELLSA